MQGLTAPLQRSRIYIKVSSQYISTYTLLPVTYVEDQTDISHYLTNKDGSVSPPGASRVNLSLLMSIFVGDNFR